jgi:hypothetical protein
MVPYHLWHPNTVDQWTCDVNAVIIKLNYDTHTHTHTHTHIHTNPLPLPLSPLVTILPLTLRALARTLFGVYRVARRASMFTNAYSTSAQNTKNVHTPVHMSIACTCVGGELEDPSGCRCPLQRNHETYLSIRYRW